jgi:thioesterase domain-containing protein/acyl carrier protein
MGRHGPLGLFTAWAVDTFGLDEKDRFCMLSGLAHDPLQRDIFTPLQLGGAICIPDPADLEAPARLRMWMSEQKITVANLTPAMSQLLTDGQTAREQIHTLRYAFLVGDVLTRRDVSRIKQLAPAVTCVNLYGSTETQRAVGYFVADNQRDSKKKGAQTSSLATPDQASSLTSQNKLALQSNAKEVLPLGRGIRDVQLLVLNQSRQLCGVGELGEIHFHSPHLAKGYLHDDDLTRARFIANPFTNDKSDRLYRTGDLGRYLPDGNVEHCGRADRQIKIRGYRIEPGEIEAALRRHSQVREIAVVPHRSASGEMRLVAYAVPHSGSPIDPRELRNFLGAKVPSYMIPAAFVVLDSLPLTPNGKLDRRALPLPDQVPAPNRNEATARSATERALIELWQEVLSIDQVGIHENFFELGGHSLLAVRLFALIEHRFDKRLPLSALFQSPTVAELAAALDKDSSPCWSSLVPIQPRGTRPPFFCVHAVGGNVLEYYDLARYLGADQPFYGLQSLGLDSRHTPHARIEDMATHYVREIRGFQPAGPYFIGGRSLGGIIAYEMARQLKAVGQQVGLLALLDSYPVGHQKLSSESATLSARSARLWRRVKSHAANLRGLSLSAQLRYLLDKSQYAPKRIKGKAWRALYRVHEKFGFALPRAFRHVEQFNWLAAHRFTPSLYDGRVTLFWAGRDLRAKFDQLEGWQTLAPGGLEVHEIPGTHLDMIKDPHVRELADKLRACLPAA